MAGAPDDDTPTMLMTVAARHWQTVPCQSFCQFLKVKNPSKLLQKDFPLGGVVKCDNDSVVRVNCVVLSDSGKSFRPGVTDDAKDAGGS